MNMTKYVLVFGALLSLGIADLATAQDEPQKEAARNASRKRDENLVTHVFQIKNLNLHDAYEAARTIYGLAHIAAVEGNNTLIIRDTPERLEQLADLFAQMAEYEPVSAKYAAEAVVLSLDHRKAMDIARLLNPIFSGARIVADDGSQQLLVTANAAQIAEIIRMVQSLDRPERAEPRGLSVKTLSVTVDFIRATVGAKGAGELPENLQGVNAALRKNGLGDAKVYGHLMVRTQEDEEFESNGVVRFGEDDSALSVLRIQGNAEMIDGQVQLRIESSLRVPFTRTRQDREGKTRTTTSYEEFSVTTTTTVPLGDYLVLGAMPASTEDSDTILMVIHITAD
ncbi:MAG: hypothetical protein IID41_10610 [Planctomycetes bacterium]|nr:hypothetical protein [Planctomycetota bacterium]